MRGERVNPLITGLITIVVVLIAVGAILVSGLPGGPPIPGFPQGMHLKAELADAHGLQPNAAVQIAGVKVGKVTGLDPAPDGGAIVNMEIDRQYADIYPDATVALRPHGLFGPKFIDLSPGTTSSSSNRLAENDVIAQRQSSQPVDLDQVLATLQDNEQAQLKTVITELGIAAEGRGDDVNHLLKASRATTALLQPPVRALNTVSGNLNTFIVQNEAFNATYVNAPIERWLQQTDRAVTVLANNSDLIGTVLTHANRTLGDVHTLLDGTAPALHDTINQLPSTLDQTTTLQNLLGLFGANLTGKEPGYSDVTPGVIAAIENIRSAFSASDPCTPGTGTCPKDGRSHYVRVQTFNITPQNPLPTCSLGQTVPILGGILPQVLPCTPTAAFAPAPGQATLASADVGLLQAQLLAP